MGVPPQREVRQGAGLGGGGFGQLPAAVSYRGHEQPGEPVEVATAFGVPHVAPFAPFDHRDLVVGVICAEPAEVQPQMPASESLDVFGHPPDGTPAACLTLTR